MSPVFVGVSALEGEILPAVGRRKERRAQDDTRGGYYVCLLAFPPAGGDPSACGRQDDTRGASRMTLKDLNQARQQDPPRRMSFITPPNNKQRSAHPTLSFRAGHPTANKDQPTKRCHSEPAIQQQISISPPNAVIQSRPHTDGPCEESPCGRKGCRGTPPVSVGIPTRREILPLRSQIIIV